MIDLLLAAALAGAPTLRLEARVDGGAWAPGPVWPLAGQAVDLRLPEVPGGRVRWYQVFPDLDRAYQNANQPWEPRPYRWRGWAEIAYSRVEWVAQRDRWEVRAVGPGGAVVADPSASPWHHPEVGSFWVEAEVDAGGRTLRTPGIEDTSERGLSPRVMRISVREDESYAGMLTSFFNVPGVFGSAVQQSASYVGVDCADVLVAAWYRHRGRALTRDYNVARLVSEWRHVARFALGGGRPDRAVAWGATVHAGDLVAVRYPGAGQFGHIGALYEDADEDGILGPADLVLHAGPGPLRASPLGDGGFDGEVVVLRPGAEGRKGR